MKKKHVKNTLRALAKRFYSISLSSFNNLISKFFSYLLDHYRDSKLIENTDCTGVIQSNFLCRLQAQYIHIAEDSILNDISKNSHYIPYAVGDRKRYATCSGVAWINRNLLAVVNLYGQHLRLYHFDPESAASPLILLKEFSDDIDYPETVAASPDEKKLAIAHSLSETKGLTINNLRKESGYYSITSNNIRYGTYHGLGFAPNSRFLAATQIKDNGFVEIVELESGVTTDMLANHLLPMRPKGVAISKDGLYLAVISANLVKIEDFLDKAGSAISLYSFNQQTGIIGQKPITEFQMAGNSLSGIECCTFLAQPTKNDIYNLLTVDQATDHVLMYSFNASERCIKCNGIISDDALFPHGIDVSPRGNYIAVANYGDDTLRMIRLPGDLLQSINQKTDWTQELTDNAFTANQLPSKLDISPVTGFQEKIPDRQTVMLCGHMSGETLAGAERSLLDLARAFNAIQFNLIVTLPSADNQEYIENIKQYCHEIYIFDYALFTHRSPSEKAVRQFSQIIIEHQVDFVHINTITLFEPLLATKRTSAKSILHVREIINQDKFLLKNFKMSAEMLLSIVSGLADIIIGNSQATMSMLDSSPNSRLLYNLIDFDHFKMPNLLGDTINFGMISSNPPPKRPG
ncbi:glycosyltransferase family 4 protein [Solemya velum gill symbiont]|uniref:glycosyltransferase family 4 protein n=1 Tax=Solemya velum gill symbiont TaxID=2340 RepID=UPI0009976338|nr:glycosyltransferase family 4 protein [Solemya velum gill symbiont]OOZ44775.1 hypothetical protein BOW37_05710 [Solemya velum gill symbiont]OOZ46901.1 hypothetical protein BOW38_05930 [Solemya velum gill symbiont]OOZ50604.1 hypothetical protein BOW39_02295 [Solemya velum gill symbiont]OOZ51849.1 hypothetical protein BOW40_05770 [Solemya velum gill symbiont]OOZ54391.1 hypothetical protein BOW41_06475 [Solemya velum gill symbiont]